MITDLLAHNNMSILLFMRSLIVLLTTLLLLSGSSIAAAAPDDPESIDEYLTAFADDNNIPGLAVRVLRDDEVIYDHASGVDGNGEAVTTDTPFLLGSIAKTVTATLVLQNVESGVLDLDDSVGDHLDWIPDPTPTVRELLTHTSGYTMADGVHVAERFDNEAGAIRRAADDLNRSSEPGTHRYSSANYLVLGAIIEEITGTPFGEHVENELLDPLGMDDSGATEERARELPPGHRYWWGLTRAYDPGFDSSSAPHGYMVSTIEDLTVFAQSYDSDELLDSHTREEAQSAQVTTSGSNGYGYGWRITERDGEPVIHHTGANPGYFAHIVTVPNTGVTVVLLANAFSEGKAAIFTEASFGVAALMEGNTPQSASSDALLTALPWVFAGLIAISLVAMGLAVRFPQKRSWRFAFAGSAVIIGALLWLIPSFLGYDQQVLRTWMPDGALALTIATAVIALTAVLLMFPVRRQVPGLRSNAKERETESSPSHATSDAGGR